MYSIIFPPGDDCIPLYAPSNASIWCNGPQVTDNYCTITCNPGFTLIGPSYLTCLPNHTWDGHTPTCPSLNCTDLEAPPNAMVASPCGTRYTSECTVVCKHGYSIPGTRDYHWSQTCAVGNRSTTEVEDGVVYWTEAKSCVYSKSCVYTVHVSHV